MSCNICKNQKRVLRSGVTYDTMISCGKCKLFFHPICVRLTKEDYDYLISENKSWYCETCGKMDKSVRYDEKDDGEVTLESLLAAINQVNNALREQQEKHDAFVVRMDDRLNNLDTVLQKVKEVMLENKALKVSITKLEAKINEIEQRSRNSSLDIVGVPIDDNESITETVKQVIRIGLDIKLDNDDIVDCFRMNPEKTNESAGHGKEKTPVIVVKLKNERVKSKILAAKSTRKQSLCTKAIFKHNNNNAIFINENLTPARRFLFNEAMSVKRNKEYMFLWTRNGTVFMRKDKSTSVITINCKEDLQNVR